MSVIHQLAKKGDYEAVKNLIKENPSLVFKKTKDGKTALHVAAWELEYDICELLQEARWIKDKYGKTALHLTSFKGYLFPFLMETRNVRCGNHSVLSLGSIEHYEMMEEIFFELEYKELIFDDIFPKTIMSILT